MDAMTGTPPLIAETPSDRRDPLSDLLAGMHLAGAVQFRVEFQEPWAVMTPDAAALVRQSPFHNGHFMPFHIIVAGGAWLEMPGGEPVWVKAGDVVLLPYGSRHRLSGRNNSDTIELGQMMGAVPDTTIPVLQYGGTGAKTDILCGFLKCDELLFHPLLKALPPLLHASPSDSGPDAWLAGALRQTIAEATQSVAGSQGMLARLTELMFVEVLRHHLASLSAEELGWFAAFNDPVTGPALRLIHAEPLRPWRVDSLARGAGVSRTVLAERFKHYLAQPPMQYLQSWRLQLAAQRLKASPLPIKTIAEDCGYESEAAFSRAFRRQFGQPPATWRLRQRG